MLWEREPFLRAKITVSLIDRHQRVGTIQSHAANLRKLRISPVQTLIEIINGEPCGEEETKTLIYRTNYTEILPPEERSEGHQLKCEAAFFLSFFFFLVCVSTLCLVFLSPINGPTWKLASGPRRIALGTLGGGV